MKRLVGNHRVFINLTETFFTDIQPLPLDKKHLVLEVLENIEPTPEVITSIQTLHAYGYVIARLNDPNADIDELATLVSQDAKLSFKILRFINSAAMGLRRNINSIKEAVIFIGMNRLRIWATLFSMAGMNDKAREIIIIGLVRGQLCQSLTRELHTGDPDSGYSVGLLSILDGILNQPMKELVKDLPFPADMKDALVYRSGPYGANLNIAMALEQGHIAEPSFGQLPSGRLNSMYLEAMIKSEGIRKELR